MHFAINPGPDNSLKFSYITKNGTGSRLVTIEELADIILETTYIEKPKNNSFIVYFVNNANKDAPKKPDIFEHIFECVSEEYLTKSGIGMRMHGPFWKSKPYTAWYLHTFVGVETVLANLFEAPFDAGIKAFWFQFLITCLHGYVGSCSEFAIKFTFKNC